MPYVMWTEAQGRNLLDLGNYRGLADGDRLWVRIEHLELILRDVLPRVDGRIILITTESDWTIAADYPEVVAAVAASGKIRRWFANNFDRSAHTDLITGLPMGLSYPVAHDLVFRTHHGLRGGLLRVDMKPPSRLEAEWEAIRDRAPRVGDRALRAFGDFHLNNTSHGRRFGDSRADIARQLAPSGCVEFPAWQLRKNRLLAEYGRHAFVICPHGRGLDCYRTWDALFMGCIPIVKTSPIDYLYADLPVVIVADWREVTTANLSRWLARFGADAGGPAVQRVLSHDYWQAQIAAYAAS
jgi:hypothetical protein